jgi:predicted dithiol-disulfide oxidoreductase (DUF899 family)
MLPRLPLCPQRSIYQTHWNAADTDQSAFFDDRGTPPDRESGWWKMLDRLETNMGREDLTDYQVGLAEMNGLKRRHHMTTDTIPHPPIVSREEWLAERKKLLADEKEQTKHYDRVNAERRRLPMVRIEKDYVFDGPKGKQNFQSLFEGRSQLIVYHFMFDPSWDKGCSACTPYVDAFGELSLLKDHDTTLVLVSRAPLIKLETYKTERGWDLPWYSSFASDFNYDFHVTLDEKVAPIEHNFLN